MVILFCYKNFPFVEKRSGALLVTDSSERVIVMKNTKRFIGCFLVLVLLISAFPFAGGSMDGFSFTAGAISSADCGKNLTWKLDSSTGTLTISGTGSMYYWSIGQSLVYQSTPPWYDNRGSIKKIVIGDGVTGIGSYAFYGCSKVESVEIPGSVKKIANKAFAYCNALTSLTVPGDGLEEIGEYAFENCNGLVSVSLPESVRTISDGAFFSCAALESINLPQSLETLGKKAFYDCGALKSIAVPGKVKSIGDKTFYHCYKLSSLTLSEGLEEIGDEAFRKCGSLETVSFPETLRTIDSQAFLSCGSLKEVTIPANVSLVGDSAFNSCSSLSSLTLCDGVEAIGKEAFSGCAIESLVLPESLKVLGDGAFMNCSQLGTITNKAKLDSFGVVVFYGTKWLDEYPDSVVYLGDVLYSVKSDYTDSVLTVKDGTRLLADSACNNLTALSEVNLPSSVEKIGKYAFYNCSSLKSVILSKNVSSVGQKAFAGCDALSEIAVFNPVCSLYDAADTLPESAVIISFENSTAQQYAEAYSRQFSAHIHEFVEIQSKPATCTENGERTEGCLCGETVITAEPATGHADKDGDGVCDSCGEVICTCLCHRSGFKGFLYKFLRIFWKLFGVNKTCACGTEHY